MREFRLQAVSVEERWCDCESEYGKMYRDNYYYNPASCGIICEVN